jgi:ligand-binding sensor domain-containing protein/signal transduction histidine kinase
MKANRLGILIFFSRIKKLLLIAVPALLIFSAPTLAQFPTYYLSDNKELTQFNLQCWDTKNGLPTYSLLSVCQTSNGYLWIASYDGLIRFDGHEFSIYNKSNTDVFESNTIRRLAEDSKGNLWMTSQGNGLVSYKNNKFQRFGEEEGLNHLYRALHIDNEDRIWSAAPEKGWFYFKNGKFNFLEHTSSLTNIEVRTIESNKEGAIWFGTLGRGLYKYSNGKLESFTVADGLSSNWIYSLFFDSNNTLWIGTSKGLCYYNDDGFNIFPKLRTVNVNDILEDKHGNIWIASTQGLYRYNPDTKKMENLSSRNGLTHNFINDFLIDLEGNMWMAFYKGGLAVLKDGKFTNYTVADGMAGKVVNAVCEISQGVFLTAFDNGELSLIENGVVRDYDISVDLSGERIRHILKDRKENLWFSTYSGLLKVAPNGKSEWIRNIAALSQRKIRLCFEDSKGNIWIGTRNNGLIKMNTDHTYELFSVANGLSANLIMSIDEDAYGNILVGTSEGESGLSIISNGKIIQTLAKEEGLLSNVIFNTYHDNENVLWVATIGGLSRIDNGKITNITIREGLLCDTPFDVLEDSIGNLWLPCSKGIMRVSKAEIELLSSGERSRVACRLFNQHDGMIVSECNPTTQSLKAINGNLIFPTVNGIAQINPSNILSNNYKPPVKINSLLVDNTPVEIQNKQIFKPGHKRFTFDYTAISLYEPKKVNFKYQLVGFDESWVDAGNNRSISYTNLEYGNYTFKVIASNNDGLWNTSGDSFSFTIRPRVIHTAGFYIVISILFLLLIYVIYVIRIGQLKRKQEQLEELIDLRTQEVRDKNKDLEEKKSEIEAQAEFLAEQKKELNLLNASKDKMFSIIAHDLRGPLGNFRTMADMMLSTRNEFDESEQEEMLRLLSQNAQSTYDLLENLLNWSSTQRGVITYEPRVLSVAPILSDIVSFVNPMAVKKQINVVIQSIDETLQVFADENMLRAILRNLIGNAIKFTREGGEIQVKATRKNKKIEFGIGDNGIGIRPEVKDKLFSQAEHTIQLGTNEEKGSGLGLLLCKEFIEKMDGKIWLESELGQGSTFYFTLNTSDKTTV